MNKFYLSLAGVKTSMPSVYHYDALPDGCRHGRCVNMRGLLCTPSAGWPRATEREELLRRSGWLRRRTPAESGRGGGLSVVCGVLLRGEGAGDALFWSPMQKSRKESGIPKSKSR